MKLAEAKAKIERYINRPFGSIFTGANYDWIINKGKAGQALEIVLGLQNTPNPLDFEDGELKTNKCDAKCRFCYDYGVLDQIPPIGEGMWEIGGTYLREEDIELLLTMGNTPTGIAYVYLEPFMQVKVLEAMTLFN